MGALQQPSLTNYDPFFFLSLQRDNNHSFYLPLVLSMALSYCANTSYKARNQNPKLKKQAPETSRKEMNLHYVLLMS